MKIVDVKPMVVQNDPPYIGGQHLLWVQVVTDEGIVGLGERVTGSGYSGNVVDLQSMISLLEEYGRYVLIGEKSVQHRVAVAADVWESARFPASESALDAGDQRFGDGVVGHRRKGDGAADLQLAGREVPREAAGVRVYAATAGRVHGQSGGGGVRPRRSCWRRGTRRARSIRSLRCSRGRGMSGCRR